MAKTDENLISFVSKQLGVEENNKYLEKWIKIYSFEKLKMN